MKQVIDPDGAPEALGAFSHATTNGDTLYTAGQLAQTADRVMHDAPIEAQTTQCLENLEAVLREAELGFEDVLKTTVYMVDIQNWEAVNEAYAEFFEGAPPARTAVGVTGLCGGGDVEIEMVASHT